MSWGSVLAIAVATTAAAWWYDGIIGLIMAGVWWAIVLGARFASEWQDRYGRVGRLRRGR